ncbi:Dynamin-like GTPase that mediates homotypic ER fusion, partial [Lobosporangium transversale]
FSDSSDPNYVFQPQYQRRVPADGLHIYAKGIWEKIMTNKDLDLPTQQELLAQFRCDEIANVAFSAFVEAIKDFKRPIESGHLVENLGPRMKEIRDTTIKSFDKDASRYHSDVYKRKRSEVLTKANSMLESFFVGQLKNLHKKAVLLFSGQLQEALKVEGTEFAGTAAAAHKDAVGFFLTGAKAIKLDDTDWEYEEEIYQLENDLKELSATQKEKEITKMQATLEKHLKKELDEPIKLVLDQPGPGMWGRVVTIYMRAVDNTEKLLQKKAKSFDLKDEELEQLVTKLKRQGWILTTKKVHNESVDGLMIYKLINRFEERFQRDERGLPRVWKPTDDIDTPFRNARDEAIALIPLYAHIDNTDPATGTKLTLESTDDFDFDQSLIVISESRQQELANQLRRKADATFVEAKRSVVATQAKVPYWVGVALVILGWNEFMTIVTNPLYLSITMTLGVPFAALWYLNMLGTVQTVGLRVYEQAMILGKERLRETIQQPEPIKLQSGMAGNEEHDHNNDVSDAINAGSRGNGTEKHLLHHRGSARSLSLAGGWHENNQEIELNGFKDKEAL